MAQAGGETIDADRLGAFARGERTNSLQVDLPPGDRPDGA